MNTITISKNEYKNLLQQAKAYQSIASKFAMQMIEKPVVSVVKNFRSTGKYSEAFLADLGYGLADLRKSKLFARTVLTT